MIFAAVVGEIEGPIASSYFGMDMEHELKDLLFCSLLRLPTTLYRRKISPRMCRQLVIL